jgi:hypothetical protein
MTPEERERLRILCDQIAKEQNRDKFTELVLELNDLLERKEHRMETRANKPDWNVSP